MDEIEQICSQTGFQQFFLNYKTNVPKGSERLFWKAMFVKDDWWLCEGFGFTSDEAIQNAIIKLRAELGSAEYERP